MNDFRNSVADLDIEVSTAIAVSSVVGDNYYKFMYITGNGTASLSNDTSPRLVTKDTYEAVVNEYISGDDAKVLAKKNFASIFTYAPNAQGYLVAKENYKKFKYYAYWTYIETSFTYESSTLALDSASQGILTQLDTDKDLAFSAFIADLAIDAVGSATSAPSAAVDAFLTSMGALSFPIGWFARGASTTFEWSDDNSGLTVGFSPALYQLGRALGVVNGTGTPVGNYMDSVACLFQDVLPTRSTSTSILENASAQFIDWCKVNKISMFKTVGNGTAQLSCYGGWTLKNTSLTADWIVAYANFMTKIDCAEIVTEMDSCKNAQTYAKCLSAMTDNVAPFVSIGRVYNYKETAPSWSEAEKLSDRETIVIPGAWTAQYIDKARKVKIEGALTV